MPFTSYQFAAMLGISTAFLAFIMLISLWDAVWKLIALWKPQKFLISDGCQKSLDF